MALQIHPSVGVARLGNSPINAVPSPVIAVSPNDPSNICLSPDTIGGLPFNGDGNGPIVKFKDDAGRIKRQGQLFRVFKDNGIDELTLDSPEVASMEWTVHLANKKAAWYQYSELQGNLLYGQENSYQNQNIPFRNPEMVTEAQRQTLIVDPGPRTISGRDSSVGFDKDNVPAGYPAQYPPDTVTYGVAVKTLGALWTDKSGRLIVLGGSGCAGGNLPLTSYGGSSTWHDDISDGPVYCTITFNDGSPAVSLSAWVIVGSPDFAPEIVNISTLSDTMFDVGVRNLNLVPQMYNNGIWNPQFKANYYRDIFPIIDRMGRYQWVSNVQPMQAAVNGPFDYADPSPENKTNRMNFYNLFRQNDAEPPVKGNSSGQSYPQEQLFSSEETGKMFPMMPLNSGSNSVSNTNIMKFMALDETQLFLLAQWAEGNFDNNRDYLPYPVHPLDAGSVGNCVGLPMCPGIEVTWSLQNPVLYAAPYVIQQYKDEAWYQANGLTPSRDECEGGGCEPGDLTKRMACPWQADFFQCTVQYINFTDIYANKATLPDGSKAPLPPSYYSYWWPPQSPWDVLVGEFTAEGQAATHVPPGEQMNYARGINSFVQMVEYWYALGFLRDKNANAENGYPFIVETERNNDLFTYKEIHIGQISGNVQDWDTTLPVFYIEPDKGKVKKRSLLAANMVEHMEEAAFKAIETLTGAATLPRSGSRSRR